MSLFFAICSLFFYWLCQLLARLARPADDLAYQKNFTCDGDHDEFIAFVRDWVASDDLLAIHQETEFRIVVEQKTRLVSFGYFYYFEFNQAHESMFVILGVQPKLIATGDEAEKILDDLSEHFSPLAQAA